MGDWGWFSWLSQNVDKLKVVRSMTTDQEQLKLLDEIICDLENKSKKD